MVSETLDITSSITDSAKLPVTVADILKPAATRMFDRAHIEVIPFIKRALISDVVKYRVEIADVLVRERFPQSENSLGIVPVLGIDEYLKLLPIDRLGLKDIYSPQYQIF